MRLTFQHVILVAALVANSLHAKSGFSTVSAAEVSSDPVLSALANFAEETHFTRSIFNGQPAIYAVGMTSRSPKSVIEGYQRLFDKLKIPYHQPLEGAGAGPMSIIQGMINGLPRTVMVMPIEKSRMSGVNVISVQASRPRGAKPSVFDLYPEINALTPQWFFTQEFENPQGQNAKLIYESALSPRAALDAARSILTAEGWSDFHKPFASSSADDAGYLQSTLTKGTARLRLHASASAGVGDEQTTMAVTIQISDE